jgi:exonuclease VII small subunit
MPIADIVRDALRRVRVGDYANASSLLAPLEALVPRDANDLQRLASEEQALMLRLITLLSEIADHNGEYDRAGVLLLPHRWIEAEVKRITNGAETLFFGDDQRDERKLLRQQLYYIWQSSVYRYRKNRYVESAKLITFARDVAERMDPEANGLLTQVYYGSAKIALHESDFQGATRMYRKSLVSASLLRSRRNNKAADDDAGHESEVAQYSIGKALALGLGQCLREQGRLEEAHMAVVAGKLLLDLGRDTDLSHHAWLLLGSIERGTAGRRDHVLLESAHKHLDKCAKHFAKHKGDVWFRSRYELALVKLQQRDLDGARAEMTDVLDAATLRESDKWIANAQIGLSRIERRANAHKKAVDAADAALKKRVSKIETRAQLTRAHALYEAAMATNEPDSQKLHDAEQDLKKAENLIDARDLRNRPMLLLLQARVFGAKGDERAAVEAFQEFQKIEDLVEVGRVRELGDVVKEELYPSLTRFLSPADRTDPSYKVKENFEAMRRHLVTKVARLPGLTDTQRAKRLGMERQNFLRLKTKYGLDAKAKRAGR